ncbi:pyridoxal phosphate-dependent decarboxylase family protein [Taibaiella soli]|uniref:Aspartate aminotransferase family protein n=1 Tax=Taibaiella soli TaxID=1649169 RepID=A0A2W2BU25_9BACT|nr:pyridoxal-dependent decarboxylase [Taibaiella soli]PZF71323.1 aspartate aminotransferase family protein [Taibaiella soli]
MKYWKKLSQEEQDERITAALSQNIDYTNKLSLGIPASKLDPVVFYDKAPFLKDAPLLRTYVQNPNHIGCHTLGDSEFFFSGTQELEREVIELLSVDMLKAAPESCDGYIAAGGTEANIQAAWIYRNYFRKEWKAQQEEIALIGSADTHYSIAKAANLLHLDWYEVAVDKMTRTIVPQALDETISAAKAKGVKYFIVISNMATTMFGSVDDPDLYAAAMKKYDVACKIHVDGAFGGFIYPVSHPESTVNFSNPNINSVTLDAHKMLQAPYGTGIFIIRKDWMKYAYTEEAQYVNGMDITLSGSRSGANAIAVWMILSTYGYFGWLEKINKLLYRTDWCCAALNEIGIRYYRHPKMNIITMLADDVPQEIAMHYGLVPDTHHGHTEWYKIVVMDHVELDQLQQFITSMKAACPSVKVR